MNVVLIIKYTVKIRQDKKKLCECQTTVFFYSDADSDDKNNYLRMCYYILFKIPLNALIVLKTIFVIVL